jgi:AcrR family transcriptional regulator
VDSAHDRIVDAALDLFATVGFAATGIRDIAKAAEVTSAALYHWYPNKDELLVSIMRRGLHRFSALSELALADVSTPEDRLATLVAVHVSSHLRIPREVQVIDTEVRSLQGDARAAIIKDRDNYEAYWTAALDAGIRTGVFDIEQPAIARLALLEMCNGVARWFNPKGALSEDEVCEAFVDQTLGAVHANKNQKPIRASQVRWPAKSRMDLLFLASQQPAK